MGCTFDLNVIRGNIPCNNSKHHDHTITILKTGLEGFKNQLPANTNFGAAVAELPDLSGDNQTEIAVGCYVASNARYACLWSLVFGLWCLVSVFFYV